MEKNYLELYTELETLQKDYEALTKTLKLFTNDSYEIEQDLLSKIEDLEFENQLLREKTGDYGE